MKNFESIKVFLILAISLIGFSLQGYRITSLQVSNASSIARLNEVEAKIDTLLSNEKDVEMIRALNNITLSNATYSLNNATYSQLGPFVKDEEGWWVAEEAMFRFPKGIVIGARNTFCNYGEGTLSVNYPESLFSTEGNCPEGKGSVVFGQANTASGKYSSVLGGYENTASGDYSVVSGGSENYASGDYSSVSGGYDNVASSEYSSVFGGETVIKQELESSILSVIPFTQDAGGWWVADKKMFRFPQGVVVGAKSSTCTYGEATLSVNGEEEDEANCPEGEGSVTFGRSNTASSDYSSVLGGYGNTASGSYSSVSGGSGNTASGDYSSVSGGSNNHASSTHASIYGGEAVLKQDLESTLVFDSPFTKDAAGWWVADMAMFRFPKGVVVGYKSESCSYGEATLSVNGGGSKDANCPEGDGAVVFGRLNTASGKWATVLGGYGNTASGMLASVLGGKSNTAFGEHSTISAGSENYASGLFSSVSGGSKNTAANTGSSVSGGSSCNAVGVLSSVLGGSKNTANGGNSAIVGGLSNSSRGRYSSINGGIQNTATGQSASVSGGYRNTAVAKASVVAGGRQTKNTRPYTILP